MDEVIRFLKEEIKGLTPADVDRLIDKVWWRQDVADGVVCFCLSHALFFFFFFSQEAGVDSVHLDLDCRSETTTLMARS